MIIGIDANEANIDRRVGANQYAFELLWSLYKIKNPHQWVIYLRERPLTDMPSERVGWVYRVFGPKKFWTQWRLPLDLYLYHPWPDIFFSPVHYTPRFSPIPIIVSIMDLGYLKFPEQFTKKDLYQLTHWTARSIKKAKHILAISQATKDDIIERYGIPKERITVTYPGYDPKKFKRQNSKIKNEGTKRKYKISGDYVLFLSTLKPSKNIENLIEAYKILSDENLDLKLVIAGKKGWMYDSIFEKVKSLGLEKKIVFTGFIPDEDVTGLMSGASVFCLPSFWEGFGIPVVEVMAMGIPVVVSDTGSLPEVVGDAGVIINPYKPVSIALGIKEALKQKEELINRGFKQIKKFSWDECGKKTLEVLEKYGNFS